LINENCELVIPEEYWGICLEPGYTVIGVSRYVENEYQSYLEFGDKLPVYYIDSDGNAEFCFWIDNVML
ncbi:MAG: hypothetical protein IKT78_03450, partial [Ruminiclostridium sp.]|nr:hypothetical protein [Ruminiclostridium sp.]